MKTMITTGILAMSAYCLFSWYAVSDLTKLNKNSEAKENNKNLVYCCPKIEKIFYESFGNGLRYYNEKNQIVSEEFTNYTVTFKYNEQGRLIKQWGEREKQSNKISLLILKPKAKLDSKVFEGEYNEPRESYFRLLKNSIAQ